jgi:hypothetical protein
MEIPVVVIPRLPRKERHLLKRARNVEAVVSSRATERPFVRIAAAGLSKGPFLQFSQGSFKIVGHRSSQFFRGEAFRTGRSRIYGRDEGEYYLDGPVSA